jgi:hypothetical protein
MDTQATGKTGYAQLTADDQQLGIRNLEFELDSRAGVSAVAERMADQASRSLLLHTENLEPAVYDRSAFLEAVSRLARSNKHARIWILVQDPGQAVRSGHRLIELSRRVSTRIQIRRPGQEYRNFHETFLLADSSGYLHRKHANRYEGIANFNDPGKVADWVKYFMEVWERSEPDAEIKRLYL